MLITFQRYVHADVELVDLTKPLEAQMQRQFLAEMDEAQSPSFRLVTTRATELEKPASAFFEFVLDFPSFDGRDPTEVAKELQTLLYDEGGVAGFFQAGDHYFSC